MNKNVSIKICLPFTYINAKEILIEYSILRFLKQTSMIICNTREAVCSTGATIEEPMGCSDSSFFIVVIEVKDRII